MSHVDELFVARGSASPPLSYMHVIFITVAYLSILMMFNQMNTKIAAVLFFIATKYKYAVGKPKVPL